MCCAGLAPNVLLPLSSKKFSLSAVGALIRCTLFRHTGSAEMLLFQGVGSNLLFCFNTAKCMEVVGVLTEVKCLICNDWVNLHPYLLHLVIYLQKCHGVCFLGRYNPIPGTSQVDVQSSLSEA